MTRLRHYIYEYLPWVMLALTAAGHSVWAWVWVAFIGIRSIARSVRKAQELEAAKDEVRRTFDVDGDAS